MNLVVLMLMVFGTVRVYPQDLDGEDEETETGDFFVVAG